MIKRFLNKNPNFNWKEFITNNKNLANRYNLNNKKKVVLFLLKKQQSTNMNSFKLFNDTNINFENINNLDMNHKEFNNYIKKTYKDFSWINYVRIKKLKTIKNEDMLYNYLFDKYKKISEEKKNLIIKKNEKEDYNREIEIKKLKFFSKDDFIITIYLDNLEDHILLFKFLINFIEENNYKIKVVILIENIEDNFINKIKEEYNFEIIERSNKNLIDTYFDISSLLFLDNNNFFKFDKKLLESLKNNIPIICERNDVSIKNLSNNYPGLIDNKKDYDVIIKIINHLIIKKLKNHKFILDFVKKKKVLFISPDITWNKVLGNSIFASNFIRVLKLYNNVDIDIGVVRKCSSNNSIFIYDDLLKYCKIFNFINNKKYRKTIIKRSICIHTDSLVNIINNLIDKYDYIIIRGIFLGMELSKLNYDNYKKKIVYIQQNKIEEIKFFKYYENIINMCFLEYINSKRINKHIIPPIYFKQKVLNDKKNILYDFCFTGTHTTYSQFDIILKVFKKFSKFKIILAGSCQVNYLRTFNILKNKYKSCKNIIFEIKREGIPSNRIDEIIMRSKVGIRLDNNNPLWECLSSKVLTYINLEIPCLIQRTKTHELLFGSDYELFLDKKPKITEKNLNNILIKYQKINYNLLVQKIRNSKKKLDPHKLINNNYRINL